MMTLSYLRSRANSIGFCISVVLLSAVTPCYSADCNAGAGAIAVERKAKADEAWTCLGIHRAFSELPAALSEASLGATNVRVTLGPGDYPVDQTLVLDSAQLKGVAVEIDSAGAGRTILRGSVLIGHSSGPWTAPLEAIVADRYLEANHGNGAASTPHHLLFVDGDQRVVPGRWPSKGWGHIVEATRTGDVWQLRLADNANQPAQLQPGRLRLAGFPANDRAYASAPAMAATFRGLRAWTVYAGNPTWEIRTRGMRSNFSDLVPLAAREVTE